MITAEEYCRKNGFNADVTFLICAAVAYDKNRDNQPWLCQAEMSRYEDEIFRVLEKMLEECDNDEMVKENNNEVIPKHYTSLKVEPIKFIEDNRLGFSAGNIIKYISRMSVEKENLKNPRRKEIKKLMFYFDYLINGNYETVKQEFGVER